MATVTASSACSTLLWWLSGPLGTLPGSNRLGCDLMTFATVVCHWARSGQGIEGAEGVIPLRIAGLNIPSDVMAKYPHLYGNTHLEIEPQYIDKVS